MKTVNEKIKKKISLVLVFLSAVTVMALDRVVDDAGLLSASEKSTLAAQIDRVIQDYRFDVVIVTQNSLNGKSVQSVADDFFDYNGYGIGANRDGLLFLLAMEEREWYISTSGYGIQVLSDYAINQIGESMASSLRNERYADAFSTLIARTVRYLDSARSGETGELSSRSARSIDPVAWVIVFGIALGLALLVAFLLKAQLKTVRRQALAQAYEKSGSFHLTSKKDSFLYSTTTKTRRETNNTSSHSSTHTSSSGRSHGGGGGRF